MTGTKYALTIHEACEFVGVSRSTIYRLAKMDTLKIRKVAGRSVIVRADLIALVQGLASSSAESDTVALG